MEHQSDYASQTVQHELEPTEPAKLESLRIQQQFITKWECTSKLEHQQAQRAKKAAWAGSPDPRDICFTSILPPACTSDCIRGKRGSPVWKRRKMPKFSLQMDWFSMCTSKMVWQPYSISTSEWPSETVTKGKSSPWVLHGVPGHIHFVWKEK